MMTEQQLTARKPRRMAREPGTSPVAIERDLTPPSACAVPKLQSKTAVLIQLMTREGGATLDQMVEATSWQPHTVRAALTGLRKKGHAVTSDKVDRTRTYRLSKTA
jgi:hypothetical protein